MIDAHEIVRIEFESRGGDSPLGWGSDSYTVVVGRTQIRTFTVRAEAERLQKELLQPITAALLADASQPGRISTTAAKIVAALHQYAAHRLDEAATILWEYRALLSADYDQKERTDLQHLYGLIKAKAEKEAKG